ncbi:hypothetical protein M407DRAFT_18978 [Tulasnella calospora MUT 4182]|uniref:Uncharacterized protein n=1 Tax=Tulasnella calospora MUT 4182 TaxID=1051891 RepID=A0A0C3QUL9_9AGAM|nr:hypothetical protein M407DRAFT_18978 [Tulasnella calospora MUT 4182]
MSICGPPEAVISALMQEADKYLILVPYCDVHAHVEHSSCPCLLMDAYPSRLKGIMRRVHQLIEQYERSRNWLDPSLGDCYLEDAWKALDGARDLHKEFEKEWGSVLMECLRPPQNVSSWIS